MNAKRMTLAQVKRLPATINVGTAAGALGFGRSTCYESIRSGDFPVRTITVRGRIMVLTADLIRVLEGGGDAVA